MYDGGPPAAPVVPSTPLGPYYNQSSLANNFSSIFYDEYRFPMALADDLKMGDYLNDSSLSSSLHSSMPGE
jgi:hypothetical protein